MAISTHETRFLLTAKDKTNLALKGARANIRSVGQAVTGLHTKMLALAGIGGLGAMLTGIIRTNSEMQTLKTSLKTVTGSTEAANSAFSRLEQFAIETPFDLNEWTEGFIKMKALGLDPSEAALTSYGNTASAMGKSLTQMIEAVADASTSQFERLLEFGIKARNQGDTIEFTFQNVTRSVGNNAREIVGYLQSIGNNEFAGSMADQMQNLKPAFSNLRQEFAELAVTIGEAGLNDAVRDLTLNITEMVKRVDPAQVQQFFDTTKNALKSAYEVVTNLPYIGEMGLIGYFLFGKKGVALAAGVSALANKLGNDIGKSWEEFNRSQVVIGSGGFTGQADFNPMPDYQIGDFNRSNGNVKYLEAIRAIESRRGDGATNREQRITNDLLREIAERLSNQNNVALAG